MRIDDSDTESIVTKKTYAKKASNAVYPTVIVTRSCKIIDALIIEYMPESGYQQLLSIVLQDIKDGTVLRLSLEKSDLEKIGIIMDTKNMVDLCSWLKSHHGVLEIDIDEMETQVTFDMLLNSLQDNSGEKVEEQTQPVAQQKTTKTVKAVKKFGK